MALELLYDRLVVNLVDIQPWFEKAQAEIIEAKFGDAKLARKMTDRYNEIMHKLEKLQQKSLEYKNKDGR